MGFNVTPEQVAAFEAARKAKAAQAQREYALLEQQRQQQQADAKARWDAVKQAQIHKAEQDYVCDHCGKLIPKGTRYRRQSVPINYGFVSAAKNVTQYVQRITHVVCHMPKCTFYSKCGNSQSTMCTNKANLDSFKGCGVYQKNQAEAQA